MITKITSPQNNDKKIAFKARYIKPKQTGELSYKTSKCVYDLKNATKDILAKLSENTGFSSKVSKVIEKYNISTTEGLLFTSVLGAGSFVQLLDSTNANPKSFVMKVKPNETEPEQTFIFEENKVVKQTNGKEKKYYTSDEINKLGIEDSVLKISETVDTVLLDLRKAFLPDLPPTQTVLKTIEVKPVVTKPEKFWIKETKPKVEEKVAEDSKIEKEETVKSNVQVKKPTAKGKFNTSDELDKILLRTVLSNSVSMPKRIKGANNTEDIGKLTQYAEKLLNESKELFEQLYELVEKNRYKATVRLKTSIPEFESIFKRDTVFSNIGKDKIKLVFMPNVVYKNSPPDLSMIYVYDELGNVIETLPISGKHVMRMRKSYDPSVSTKPSIFVSLKTLSQAELDSKNVTSILSALKTYLSQSIEALSEDVAKLPKETVNELNEIEQDLVKLTHYALDSKVKTYNHSVSSTGASVFKNINPQRERFYWIPALGENKHRNTTIIRLQDEAGETLESLAIYKGRVLKEHPKPYSDFIPKKPKYYTVQELEDLNINEKLKSYIATLRELINSNTDVIKNIVEWRDKSKKI